MKSQDCFWVDLRPWSADGGFINPRDESGISLDRGSQLFPKMELLLKADSPIAKIFNNGDPHFSWWEMEKQT